MLFNNAEIPTALIDASLSGSLVVFAGAGVSKQRPVGLPLFDELVQEIKDRVDPANRLKPRKSIKDENGDVVYKESPEQYLSYLESKGRDIRAACAALTSSEGQTSQLHCNLIRLFPGGLLPRVVTTNFDDCFENALDTKRHECPVFVSPALPLGSDVEGIVHLHGVVGNHKSMVLTAEDYGRAYVTNGWSSRFLVDLFKTYTVLFVGYSCGDSLVDYLTRSISSEISGNAYALCRESDDVDDWVLRGVEPVAFNDFDDLPGLVGEWAAYIERSVTDRVVELRKLGRCDDLAPEQCDSLIYSLRWHDESDRELFAREFCAHSKCFSHLRILHERGLTGFLTEDAPTGAGYVLLQWAVNQFSVDECGEFQLLLSSMRNELSVRFYDLLVWNLIRIDAPSSAIGPWIAWLECAPYQYQVQCGHGLAHIASSNDNPDIVLAILRMLLKVNMGFTDDILSGLRKVPVIPVNGDFYEKQLIKGLKRHIDAIGERMFEYCFFQIELAYSIQTGCWTNAKVFDAISYSRSSVEPHEQDSHSSGAGSTLLNIARDSIGPEIAAAAAEKCLRSQCALLVRLGLWAMNEYECKGSCLELVINNGYLENTYLHHESFQLIRSSFEIASSEQRRRFADYLRQLYADEESDYSCFNMCNWILEKVEDPDLLEMRANVLARHPEYLPRKHPDLTHYMTCGFVDNSAECRIARENFTIKSMLERTAGLGGSRSYVTPQDIVSVPARDYPDVAIDMLRELLQRERSSEEDELCNLLISSVAWESQEVCHADVLDIMTLALSDRGTTVAAVDALASCTLFSRDGVDWSRKELERLLLAAKSNLAVLLEAESAIVLGEEPDWVLVGINQPVGRYLELIARLEGMVAAEDLVDQTALSLLMDLDIISMPESPTAKALIACFFVRFNTWAAADYQYSESMARLLVDASWSQIPAWQGLSRLSRLSEEAWEITIDCWRILFEGRVAIHDEFHTALVGLYTWLAIIRANKEDRVKMLKVCGSASDKSLQTVCMRIDDWLGTLGDDGRVAVWDDWLSESFEYLASINDESKKTIAGFYCRWIRAFPGMRKHLVQGLMRDCAGWRGKDLSVHDGVLEDVASDQGLTVKERATMIAFLLEHQNHLRNDEDAKRAASLISLSDLDDGLAARLQDAYTRSGMSDVAFRE